MFKVQTKEHSFGKRWQDLRFNRDRYTTLYATEAEAWQYVESLDQDGFRDTANFRVVEAE